MEATSEYVWSPPVYYTGKNPQLTRSLNLSPDPLFPENFVRLVKWSPDGSLALAQCENRTLQIFDPESSGKMSTTDPHSLTEPSAALSTNARIFNQPAPILDFVWYPTASPQNPASFCFVASVRECPVKLLDASDGRLRASYRIVDHRERQIAPHSLAFNLTGERLYCGFEDAIEVFDVSRPGEGKRLHTTPSKKSKDGLKGIISALAFSPSYSEGESFYAAGSFSPTPSNIALFSDSQSETPIMFLGGGPRAGVTQVQFNPSRPHILYAAYRGRGSGSIYSWDLRANLGSPVEVFCQNSAAALDASERKVNNQKMRFDVDVLGRYLGVGDPKGNVSVFDLGSSEKTIDDTVVEGQHSFLECDTQINRPVLEFIAHEDAVGSVTFNPLRPVALSVSGARHFKDVVETDSSNEEDDEVDDLLLQRNAPTSPEPNGRKKHSQPVTFDSSIKLWDFSRPTESELGACIGK